MLILQITESNDRYAIFGDKIKKVYEWSGLLGPIFTMVAMVVFLIAAIFVAGCITEFKWMYIKKNKVLILWILLILIPLGGLITSIVWLLEGWTYNPEMYYKSSNGIDWDILITKVEAIKVLSGKK